METGHDSPEGDQVNQAATDAASALALTLAAVCRRYQNSTELLIRKAPFARVVREIAQDYKVASATLCIPAAAR